MTSVLESILEGVREDLANRKKSKPDLSEDLSRATPVLNVYNALASPGMKIIAEVKRSSPSKGQLAPITDPAGLADRYQTAGAAVISVLTEERRFNGSLADFKLVRDTVTTPMLRKDFTIDEYQIMESRAYGADMQLLIVAALSKSQLRDFFQLGNELGLASLIEVHSFDELEIAMSLDPKIIGVNSRNLKTLEVDPALFSSIIPQIPKEVIKVAESGISKRSEVELLESIGTNAILVGETLVRAGSPESAIRTLLGG